MVKKKVRRAQPRAKFMGRWTACVAGLGMAGACLVLQGQALASDSTASAVAPGMQCTVNDGWWSLDQAHPVQAEPVRVVKLQALASSEPGAWVQPLRGPLTGHQYQIALHRLQDCKQ